MNIPLQIVDDCAGCGVCCLHMAYPAFNLPDAELLGDVSPSGSEPGLIESRDRERWQRLPDKLRAEIRIAIRSYVPPRDGRLDGPCVWLDPTTQLCKYHEHRPQICRDFPIGGNRCREWRKFYAVRIQR